MFACVGRRDFVLLGLLHIIAPNSFHNTLVYCFIILLVCLVIVTHKINIVHFGKSQYGSKLFTPICWAGSILPPPVRVLVGTIGIENPTP